MTELQNEITRLEFQLASRKAELTGKQSLCRHQFGEPKYDPIIIKGYTILPRTAMNYDDIPFAQGYVVEDRVTPRWKRTCPSCGKIEYTTITTSHTTVTPKF